MPSTVFDYAAIADGQLSNSLGTLYTVPASTQIDIGLWFQNTNAASNTVTVKLNISGSDRQLCAIALAQNETLIIEGIVLAAGHLIKASATNSSQVDYIVSGVKAT